MCKVLKAHLLSFFISKVESNLNGSFEYIKKWLLDILKGTWISIFNIVGSRNEGTSRVLKVVLNCVFRIGKDWDLDEPIY